MLELKDVSKQVGADYHIRDVSLRLERGSLNVLLGPTLSGKTSLMRLMAGLDRPTRGSVWFDGRDVTGTPVQSRNVAMVYQQFINYPSMTVFDNIASPLKLSGQSRADIERRVRELAEKLHIDIFLNRLPAELSGGQQQRVAIARAIVTEPRVLLADEPTGNLDTQRSKEIMELLWRLNVDFGITVLMVTHEPDMAAYAKRVVRFVDGVVESDTPNPQPTGLTGQAAMAPDPGAP